MLTNVTLVFFLLLIPLAGFIAWAGDRIGHRTGKRRQSLFGLRPRHTAMVFTIGSGMAIALVSFLVFWLSSETFRIVVRDGAELYQNNRRLKQENLTQARSLSVATSLVQAAHQDIERLEEERKKAEGALGEAVRSLAEAQKRQAGAEKRAKEAQASFAQAMKDLTAAHADLSEARQRLTTTQTRLDEQDRRFQQAQRRTQIAEKQVKIAEDQAKAAKADVGAARQQTAIARQEKRTAEQSAAAAKANVIQIARTADQALQMQAANVKKQIDELKQDLDKQNRQYAELAGKTEQQRLESVRLTRELEDKRREYDQVLASTSALRRGQITYQVGEEVDRLAIRPGSNIWRLQIMLDSFLTAAGKKAEARGAGRTGQGKFDRAVVIVPRPMPAERTASATNSTDETPRLMTEDEAIRAASDLIRRKNEDILVVASSAGNAIAGEPVAIELRIYPNPVVLAADAKVGEITVSGEGTRQEVADTLYTFLNRDVHKKLLDAGMIPPTNGASGAFTLSGEEWLDIMDQVRRAGPRARVTVFAAKDLRASDAPNLRFEVKPIYFGVSSNSANR